jgi:hypothetical protein
MARYGGDNLRGQAIALRGKTYWDHPMVLATQSGIIYDTPPPFSAGVLLLLLALLCVSSLVFWALIRRSTSHRQWITLQEWARERGFSMRNIKPTDLPPPLAALSPLVRLSVADANSSLVQMETDAQKWNLLIRKMSNEWIPSGLRPAKHDTSVLDQLRLSTYPAYSSAQRFHLVSADSAAARKLSRSITRALIPADVGLLLWGNWLVLDFTHRPFDPVEFGRMIALGEQVAALLP